LHRVEYNYVIVSVITKGIERHKETDRERESSSLERETQKVALCFYRERERERRERGKEKCLGVVGEDREQSFSIWSLRNSANTQHPLFFIPFFCPSLVGRRPHSHFPAISPDSLFSLELQRQFLFGCVLELI
jgi:hypothetical protein